MTDLTKIIKTKIVGKEWDIFWENSDLNSLKLTTNDVLVVSTVYTAGSAEEVQLQKMLKACHLDEGQYEVVKLKDGQNISWHQLRDLVHPKVVLLLGVLPVQLGVSAVFGFNVPNRFNDCLWIPSLSLDEMEKQPEAKRQLWQEALKPVFVDKAIGNT